jgi:hypothetical protein
MRTKVYGRRLYGELESDLEREARKRKVSVSVIPGLAVSRLLRESGSEVASDEAQR